MEKKYAGCTVKDVAAAEFIAVYAAHLKKVGAIEVPKYVDYVKTSPRKELAPYDQDWYYVRVASLARRVYCRGGTGVGSFAKVYGGTKNNGTRPSHFKKASRSIIRHALQQLEKVGVIEKDPHGGRRLTRKGQAEMDTQAATLLETN
ncbi:40S ribosomal protein S19-1 [Porphyridium purpureum]|uniref:40S ribosomal protein S19-1 n=1 Tax=Porphyridium purpureum TaxID=35688 RepID=A0A5J4YVN2_PORPP|nr:40S ribosomal protein S19-1 [Porphyridium purpureum]|eukprot:POR6498..scf227_4